MPERNKVHPGAQAGRRTTRRPFICCLVLYISVVAFSFHSKKQMMQCPARGKDRRRTPRLRSASDRARMNGLTRDGAYPRTMEYTWEYA